MINDCYERAQPRGCATPGPVQYSSMVSASFSFCLQVLPWVPPLTALSDGVGPEDLCAGTHPSHTNPSHFGRGVLSQRRKQGLTSDSDSRKTEFVTLPLSLVPVSLSTFRRKTGDKFQIPVSAIVLSIPKGIFLQLSHLSRPASRFFQFPATLIPV